MPVESFDVSSYDYNPKLVNLNELKEFNTDKNTENSNVNLNMNIYS